MVIVLSVMVLEGSVVLLPVPGAYECYYVYVAMVGDVVYVLKPARLYAAEWVV